MRAFAIAAVAFLAGAGGGIACALYLIGDVHDRIMDEWEGTHGFRREVLSDDMHAVKEHYFPLRTIQRGNFAGLTQWHCYALGIRLRGLRPGMIDDPGQSKRAEELRTEASALLEELEQNGTCLAPGGLKVGPLAADD